MIFSGVDFLTIFNTFFSAVLFVPYLISCATGGGAAFEFHISAMASKSGLPASFLTAAKSWTKNSFSSSEWTGLAAFTTYGPFLVINLLVNIFGYLPA